MKSWKKQMNREFDDVAPKISDRVLNAPINTARADGGAETVNGGVLVMKRIGISSACVAVALALVFMFLGVFGVFGKNSLTEGYVFTYEINPAVAFITDKDGKVISVKALNKDADVVLCDENILVKLHNVPIADAVVAFTDEAARLGYLDVEAEENAVRLSGADGESKIFAAAADSLRGYFRENGIFAAVVEDSVTVKELSKRVGFDDINDLTGIINAVKSLPIYFGERKVDTASPEELAALYDDYILGGQFLELMRGELLDNAKAIIANAQLIARISVLNYNIMMHEDNPFSPFPADYWAVKKYPNAVYGDEFSALISEMDTLLDEYATEFGIALNSLSDLTSAAEAYASLANIDFYELFSSITKEDFSALAERFVSMLDNIGNNVDALKTLLNKSQTPEEYKTQMKTVLGELFDYREKVYLKIYNEERTELSQSEYESFISNIEQKYGSLENFWNEK